MVTLFHCADISKDWVTLPPTLQTIEYTKTITRFTNEIHYSYCVCACQHKHNSDISWSPIQEKIRIRFVARDVWCQLHFLLQMFDLIHSSLAQVLWKQKQMYKNKNNREPYMMSKSNGFKMVYFRRSLKKYLDTNISDSHSRIHLQE